MLSKKQLAKLFVQINSLLTMPFVPFITSCKSDHDGFDININEYQQIVNESNLLIPFNVDGDSCSSVDVEITNANTDKINISSETIQLENNHGSVSINIDSELIDGFHVHFDLIFRTENKKGESIFKTIYDLNFVYITDPHPEEQDIVIPTKTKDTEINLHTFTYKINFLVPPKSNKIKVELLNDYSGLLHLKESEIQVQQSYDEIFIEIPISLDFSVFSSFIMYFGLTLDFTNSYGSRQVYSHNGFILDFKKTSKEFEPIPEEYFNLEKTGDDVILHGFNENIRSEDLVSYDIVQIPEDVTKIDGKLISSDSLNNLDWSSSIKKIVFGGKEKEICEDFFAQFQNILEIDFCKYGNQIPNWLEFETHLFDSTSMFNKYGYIWIDDAADNIAIIQQFIKCGLADKWETMNIGKVTGETFFNINNEKHIIGISDEGKNILQNIKLVRIPHEVTEIEPDALNDIKITPYLNPKTNQLETRRLMLDGEISSLLGLSSYGIFQNIGISGPIIINCPKITSIGQCTFADITHYNIQKYYEVIAEPTTFFSVVSLANLTEIDKYAFAYSLLSDWDGNMLAAEHLTRIDEFAFESHRFTSIKLSKTITDVGQFAFANSYYEPTTPSLTSIDLSQFNKIVNPEEVDPKLITHVPIWMSEQRNLFDGACCQTGTLKLSKVIKEEVDEKHDKWEDEFLEWDKWILRLKGKLAIPANWSVELID